MTTHEVGSEASPKDLRQQRRPSARTGRRATNSKCDERSSAEGASALSALSLPNPDTNRRLTNYKKQSHAVICPRYIQAKTPATAASGIRSKKAGGLRHGRALVAVASPSDLLHSPHRGSLSQTRLKMLAKPQNRKTKEEKLHEH